VDPAVTSPNHEPRSIWTSGVKQPRGTTSPATPRRQPQQVLEKMEPLAKQGRANEGTESLSW
jgi:hypothetical protein